MLRCWFIVGVLSSISVTGYSGGGIAITCKYDGGYKTNAKYFCKGQWSDCTDQIRTGTKDKWFKSGRFSLFDDTTAAVFTVTIRDLTEQDSGIYYCGTDIYAKVDSEAEVNLNVIQGPKIGTVRGYSGGKVIIDYEYGKQHKHQQKYVCKSGADQCIRVYTSKSGILFSIDDDRSAGLLHVLIEELNQYNSGEYSIMVRVSEDYSFFSEFQLLITDAACCQKSISLSAAAGGSVNISCKYPQSHTADVKFVCRRSGADLCAEETRSGEESGGGNAEGKIQLYDDREEQLLTATVSHESPEHSAEYWCGVQSAGHKSFITRVIIHFTDAETTSPRPSSLPSSSSSSSSLVESPLQRMCVSK